MRSCPGKRPLARPQSGKDLFVAGHAPAGSARPRRRVWGIIGIAAAALVALVIVTMAILDSKLGFTTNVTISLSYVADDGQKYSCTYDYSTPDRLPMPADIAESMNSRDWSQTGQEIFEWAKSHPAEHWTTEDELPADDPGSTRADATWGLAMEKYVTFPPWLIDAGDGEEYALWWEARAGSNCADGLR